MNNTNTNMNKDKINQYIDCIDIIYWINLDRSVDRRKRMEENLKNFNIQNKRIIATDVQLIDDKDLDSYFINYDNFNRTKVEYVCLHSHLKTIDEFSTSPYEIALIFEDDLSLEYVELWDKKLSEIIKNAPKDWDIIMLNYNTKKQLYDEYTYNYDGEIASCLAYIINNKSAKKLMNSLKKNNKYILHKNTIHTSDNYIYSLLRTYVYKYPYFTYPSLNDSTIHPSHLFMHTYSKNIAERNWKLKYNTMSLSDLLFPDGFVLYNILIITILLIIVFLFINKYFKNKIHF